MILYNYHVYKNLNILTNDESLLKINANDTIVKHMNDDEQNDESNDELMIDKIINLTTWNLEKNNDDHSKKNNDNKFEIIMIFSDFEKKNQKKIDYWFLII